MTVTLTMNSWDGDLPLPGHYLKAERGRTAFLVVEVKRARPGSKHVGRLICEREKPEQLRADDVVHPWAWSAR